MKTEQELDQIVTQICHDVANCNDAAASVKRLRGIQIDALRHAREITERAGDDDLGHSAVIHDLDKLILGLELR